MKKALLPHSLLDFIEPDTDAGRECVRDLDQQKFDCIDRAEDRYDQCLDHARAMARRLNPRDKYYEETVDGYKRECGSDLYNAKNSCEERKIERWERCGGRVE